MSGPTELSGVAYSDKQGDLFRKWLDHFGTIDAKELDLGMLTAIHEWVIDGLAPNGKAAKDTT